MRIYSKEFITTLFIDSRLHIHDSRNALIKHVDLPCIKKKNTEEQGNTRSTIEEVIACNISADMTLIGIATSFKRLLIWNLSTLALLIEEEISRTPVAITFVSDFQSLLVADKAGDVFSYSLNKSNCNDSSFTTKIIMDNDDYIPDVEVGPEPLMGHLSMLMDIIATSDGKFVVTCDRDEKIRVSQYPNMYNIHSYCLGHEDFVCKILEVPNRNGCLVSGSGDGTVRLWDYHLGKCLSSVDVKSFISQDVDHTNYLPLSVADSLDDATKDKTMYAVTRIALHSSHNKQYLAVVLYGVCGIIFFSLEENSIVFSHQLRLALPVMDIASFGEDCLAAWLQRDTKQQNPLVVFRVLERQAEVCDKHSLVDFISEHLSEFAVTPRYNIQGLYKKQFDNFATYLAKKEARISLQACSIAEGQPATKKPKIV